MFPVWKLEAYLCDDQITTVKAKATEFLTRVDRTTLTADVCRKLMTHLVRGDWSEGERIPSERELCERLGVGRASLREALKALEMMGMIEVRVGDGTFVCHRSEFLSRPLLWALTSRPTDIRELVEARGVLEKELAELAAERANADDLAEIGKHLDAMEKAVGEPVAFLEADLNFHLAIARAAHNRILLNAVQLMRNLMRQWMSQASTLRGVPPLAVEQHRAIFLAIAKKNRAESRKLMASHLAAMAEALMTLQEGHGDRKAEQSA
jgi:GntR family transcriptional repressor for pyruvate dehydrogenase complex